MPRFLLLFPLLLSLIACVKEVKRELPQEEIKLSLEEQEKRSLEIFNLILEVSTSSPDRREVLPEMEKLYKRIIKECPDVPLAQESYLRLVILYLKDYDPPRSDDAMELYNDFLKKYPASVIKSEIEDSMMKFYYQRRIWNKLLDMQIPYIKEYIKTGELKTPVHIFYYAEAKMSLGDIREAEKGYRTIITLFPQSIQADISKKRLEEITKIK